MINGGLNLAVTLRYTRIQPLAGMITLRYTRIQTLASAIVRVGPKSRYLQKVSKELLVLSSPSYLQSHQELYLVQICVSTKCQGIQF